MRRYDYLYHLTAYSTCDIVKLTKGDEMKKKPVKSETKLEVSPAWTRAEWLQTVIKLTKTAIDPTSDDDGNGMIAQLAKYTKELKGLKK
jgi:hypothetical protein